MDMDQVMLINYDLLQSIMWMEIFEEIWHRNIYLGCNLKIVIPLDMNF